ncbi:MAG: heavy metal translocating P-type ATPase [Clostridia bacterium]|nr:heavy metal translocating P-type ATPase [Clostridia bacterium]
MKRLHYEIKGMSCAACVSHVERAIRGVLGEGEIFTVSLLTNSVSILINNDQKDLALLEKQLEEAIKNSGYTLLTNKKEEQKTGISEFEIAKRKLIASAALTLAVMYLAMGGMIGLPIPEFLVGVENAIWMALSQLILTVPVLVINFKFFKNGFLALGHRAPNMDSLIAVGSGASVIYGLVSIVLILTANGDGVLVHSLLHDLYFESAAMILTLVSLGKLLESRAKEKAADAVKSLASLSPKSAAVLREGMELSIPVEEIVVGDTVIIRAGELIPVDGVIVKGEGSADESALTGESMPVEKEAGDAVRAACVLTSGYLEIRAEKVGSETSLSRIIRLLEDAAASKAPIARIADKVSGVFVPVVMAISLVTFLVWMLVTNHIEQALRSAIAVLVISCPCALGLATPTAITVGIGRGARNGILFRNAESLEKLCSVKTVLFDKTGTITEGKPSLTDLYAYGTDPVKLLQYAAAVEKQSSHPLALAVVRGAEEMKLEIPTASEFRSMTGVGAEAEVCGAVCRIGKPSAEERAAWTVKEYKKEEKNKSVNVIAREDLEMIGTDFDSLEEEGKTAVLVTVDGKAVGVLGISDRIREDSPAAVEALRSEGVSCVMLTGDNERTAASVARRVGLDGYRAGLLPEDKEQIVRQIGEGSSCAMVGDGINDAPALVRADVGIAVGAGTEVAIDCAGVVLSGSSLSGVAEAYRLSRATIRIIKQNLFWALFYNAVCIPVAAGALYPLFGWQLSPMLASAAMSFSSVCVVTNALRLRTVKLFYSNRKQNTEGDNEEMMFGKKEVYSIPVEGMMCPRCVAHVKEALEAIKGVKEVEVSLEEKKAVVTVKEGAVTPATIISAIQTAGYTPGEAEKI